MSVGEASEKAAEGEQAQGTKTRAEEFRSCVAGSGAPAEKEAVEHVTKVTGAPPVRATGVFLWGITFGPDAPQ